MNFRSRVLPFFMVFLGACAISPDVPAPANAPLVDTSRDNLMVVLREAQGANKENESLEPFGKAKVKLSDGEELVFDPAWYLFLGDMHVRFVFEGPRTMVGATGSDLARLQLTPEQALKVAVDNLKRDYGKPVSTLFADGIWEVRGRSPEFDSSYVLDRAFWQDLLRQHPEGLVVAVPKRGGLVYAIRSDERAVASLKKGVSFLFTSSSQQRVSSALYLFKDDHWSVFQRPIGLDTTVTIN